MALTGADMCVDRWLSGRIGMAGMDGDVIVVVEYCGRETDVADRVLISIDI